MAKVASTVAANSPQITSIQTIIKAQLEQDMKNNATQTKNDTKIDNSLNEINIEKEKLINNRLISLIKA